MKFWGLLLNGLILSYLLLSCTPARTMQAEVTQLSTLTLTSAFVSQRSATIQALATQAPPLLETPSLAMPSPTPSKRKVEITITDTPQPTITPTGTPTQNIEITPTPILTPVGAGRVHYILEGRISSESRSTINIFLDAKLTTVAMFDAITENGTFSDDETAIRVIFPWENEFRIFETNLLTFQEIEYTGLVTDPFTFDSFDHCLSPTGEWLAYKTASGRIDMSQDGAEFQDVDLVKINTTDPEKPIRLTRNGGAQPAEMVWSPDGRYLAFTDFDESQVMRIYLYDVDAQKLIQLSQFVGGSKASPEETKITLVGNLIWSPDSSALAFSTSEWLYTPSFGFLGSTFDHPTIGIITMTDQEINWLDIPGLEEGHIVNVIWDQSGEFIEIYVDGLGDSTIGNMSILWYEISSRKWDVIAVSSDLQLYEIFPMDGNEVGAVGGKIIAVCNRELGCYKIISIAPIRYRPQIRYAEKSCKW